MRKHLEQATELDVCGGDLGFRATREDWKNIGGGFMELE